MNTEKQKLFSVRLGLRVFMSRLQKLYVADVVLSFLCVQVLSEWSYGTLPGIPDALRLMIQLKD